MYSEPNLKPRLRVTATHVECPVQDCAETVERQRHRFRRDPKYRCPRHGIYISPSAFEYDAPEDNLLWTAPDDLALLEAIQGSKRENRMARDNSEDAVTWNVFRYYERTHQLSGLLAGALGCEVGAPEVIYWSYSQQERTTWTELIRARKAFGEDPDRGTEPDLIVLTPEALVWIEAKLGAPNRTVPSNPGRREGYLTGGNGWFAQVCRGDYETIAITEKLYELLRMWLLGTWLARELGPLFVLINLVPEARETDIEARLIPHLVSEPRRRFLRWTWEAIYRHTRDRCAARPDRERLLDYFQGKTLGYDHDGRLQKAFAA
jgi:hypothetical protein